MKKSVLVSIAFLSILFALPAQGQTREERKAMEEAQARLDYNLALEAINGNHFALLADRVLIGNEVISPTVKHENYVLLNGDMAIVQFSFGISGAGLNGAGGITIEGRVTNLDVKVKKKGDITYRFVVEGNGISVSVTIMMGKDNNFATARINPTFTGTQITLYGNVVQATEADVFKGRPSQSIPRGFMFPIEEITSPISAPPR